MRNIVRIHAVVPRLNLFVFHLLVLDYVYVRRSVRCRIVEVESDFLEPVAGLKNQVACVIQHRARVIADVPHDFGERITASTSDLSDWQESCRSNRGAADIPIADSGTQFVRSERF